MDCLCWCKSVSLQSCALRTFFIDNEMRYITHVHIAPQSATCPLQTGYTVIVNGAQPVKMNVSLAVGQYYSIEPYRAWEHTSKKITRKLRLFSLLIAQPEYSFLHDIPPAKLNEPTG